MQRKSIPHDTHELAWAAGFFDGEGSTNITRYTPKNQHKSAMVLTLGISQTNSESLERFRAAVDGLGVINGPYKPPSGGPGNKPQWKYRASGVERVHTIVTLLWPWLGREKRDQAMAALVVARAQIRRPGRPTQELCVRGHDYGIDGEVMRGGRRVCKRCEQLLSLASYYRRIGNPAEAQRVLDGTHVSRKGWRRKDRTLVID